MGDETNATESELLELNGKKLTESQFKEEVKTLESKPGVKVVEVSPGVYKTRIQG